MHMVLFVDTGTDIIGVTWLWTNTTLYMTIHVHSFALVWHRKPTQLSLIVQQKEEYPRHNKIQNTFVASSNIVKMGALSIHFFLIFFN